jgi:hypothetical protein
MGDLAAASLVIRNLLVGREGFEHATSSPPVATPAIQSVATTTTTTTTTTPPTPRPHQRNGYWILDSQGNVYAFGNAHNRGALPIR